MDEQFEKEDEFKDLLEVQGNWIKAKEMEAGKKFSELSLSYDDWLHRINRTGVHEEGTILSPIELGRIEIWYSVARSTAYDIAGLCREMQRFYEAQAEQGQANMYEKVKLGKYNKKLNNSTDAQYISRRAKGKLLQHAAVYEGDYFRWKGFGDSHESAINAVKDMFKVAEHEFNKDRLIGTGR